MTTRRKSPRTFTVLPAAQARATTLEVLPDWEDGKALDHAREYIPDLFDDVMGAIVEAVKMGEFRLHFKLDNMPSRRINLLTQALGELGYETRLVYDTSRDIHRLVEMLILWQYLREVGQ
jgi:hypothetical protein